MLGFRLACLLVQFLDLRVRESAHPGAAVLYDIRTGAIEAWASDSRERQWDVGTPATNVMRAYQGSLRDCVVLVSRAPTAMCLGMAKIAGAQRLIHVSAKAPAVFYAPGNNLAARSPLTIPAVPVIPAAIRPWLDECEALLLADGDFPTLFGRCPDTEAEWPRMIGDAMRRRLAPRVITPDAPTAPDGPTAEPGPELDAFWMTVARRLTGLVHQGSNLDGGPTHGHNIGCVLVSATNRLLAWGVNTTANHSTFHAETKCIWMFQRLYPGEKVPGGARFYTTLQSCVMCSGAIKHACADSDVRVIYADSDSVANSVLTRDAGAREVRLIGPHRADMPDSCLQDRPDLATGHHLLAVSRWDRMRRAFHQHLDRGLTGGPYREERDRIGVNQFLQLMQRTRPEIEARMVALRTVPRMPDEIRGMVDAFILHRRENATKAAAATATASAGSGGAAAAAAAATATPTMTSAGAAPGKRAPRDASGAGAAIGRVVAQTRQTTDFLHRQQYIAHAAPQLRSLTVESARHLAVEQAAIRMRYSGGAPLLLYNPVIYDRLSQTVDIRRRARADPATLTEAIARTQQRIADLTTQLHAIDLLLRVVAYAPGYAEH